MDSVSPPAADFGRTSVGIYTGSVNQQTLFLDLGTVADPTSVLQLEAERIPGGWWQLGHARTGFHERA